MWYFYDQTKKIEEIIKKKRNPKIVSFPVCYVNNWLNEKLNKPVFNNTADMEVEKYNNHKDTEKTVPKRTCCIFIHLNTLYRLKRLEYLFCVCTFQA